MRLLTAVLILFSASLVSHTASADTLVIDNARQSQAQQLPARGMLKSQVERQYGAPRERVAATGQPPISRWVYDGYTVYFEYDHVITSVLHHRAP